MKKNKGFTLVELLGVIVILAIIALISIPIVVGTLKNVRKAKFKQNAVGLLNVVKLERENKNIIGNDEVSVYDISLENKSVSYKGVAIDTEFNGEIDGEGLIVANRTGKMAIRYSNGEWCAYKNYEDAEVKITSGDCQIETSFRCELYNVKLEPSSRWSQYKKVVGEYDTSTCESVYYRINNGEYQKYTGEVRLNEEASVDIKTISKYGIEEIKNIKVTNIDRTAPEKVTIGAMGNTRSIEVVVTSAVDKESGPQVYAYSIDGGNTWTDYVYESRYVFNNLEPGTYRVQAKVYNGTYGAEGSTSELGEKKSNIVKAVVTTCPVPQITIKPSVGTWSQLKKVEINYGDNKECVGSYSLDGGTTYINEEPILIYDNNVSVVAKNTSWGNNQSVSSSYTIDHIDRSMPTKATLTIGTVTTNSIEATVSGKDSESGIYRYRFSSDNGVTWTDIQTSNVYKFENLTGAQYNIKAKVYNGAWYNTQDEYKDESIGTRETEASLVTLQECPAPEITVSPSGDVWSASKIVTIKYKDNNECSVKKYSLDGEVTWKTASSNTITETLNKSATVVGYQGISDTKGKKSTYRVDKIDETIPVVNFTATSGGNSVQNGSMVENNMMINMSCSAGESGITEYKIEIKKGTTVLGSETLTVDPFDIMYEVMEAQNGGSITESTVTAISMETYILDPAMYNVTENGEIIIGITCKNGAEVTSTEKELTINYQGIIPDIEGCCESAVTNLCQQYSNNTCYAHTSCEEYVRRDCNSNPGKYSCATGVVSDEVQTAYSCCTNTCRYAGMGYNSCMSACTDNPSGYGCSSAINLPKPTAICASNCRQQADDEYSSCISQNGQSASTMCQYISNQSYNTCVSTYCSGSECTNSSGGGSSSGTCTDGETGHSETGGNGFCCMYSNGSICNGPIGQLFVCSGGSWQYVTDNDPDCSSCGC